MNRSRFVSSLTATLIPLSAVAQIVPDGRTATSVGGNGNGRTTVNIAPAVSTNRVSYNGFSQFSVGPAGVDINNTQVQARLIVTEVTSTLPSLIQGDIAILGPRANFVLANPNGITVDGGRFINTGSVALATGRVQLLDAGDPNGVSRRDVQITTATGRIDIGAGGLAGAFNNLELISKELRIAGPVLNSTDQPSSRIRSVTGNTTAIVDSSVSPVDDRTPWVRYGVAEEAASSPRIAVDITSLGSLTAGRVEILVTDRGAGVRHAGRGLASVGDFIVQADGRVDVAGGSIKANERVVLSGGRVSVTSSGADDGKASITANGDVQLLAPEIELRGANIRAGDDTHLGTIVLASNREGEGAAIRVDGVDTGAAWQGSILTASGGIALLAKGHNVAISGSDLKAVGGIRIEADRVLIEAGRDRQGNAIQAASLDSERGTLEIDASGALVVTAATLQGGAGVTVTANDIAIGAAGGRGGDLVRSAVQSNGGGIQLRSAADTRISASDVLARSSVHVHAGRDLVVSSRDGKDGIGRLASVEGGLLIEAGRDVTNYGGVLQGERAVEQPAEGSIDLAAPAAVSISAGRNVLNRSLNGDALAIIFGSSGNVQIEAGGDVLNQTGRVISNRRLSIAAEGDVLNITENLPGDTQPQETRTKERAYGLFNRRISAYSMNFGQLTIPGQQAFFVANGDLMIKGRNVVSLGGDIISNEGSVDISARDVFSTEGFRTGSMHYEQRCLIFCRARASSDVAIVGGGVNAGLDVRISAGTRIVNQGGRVLALGNIALKAPEIEATSIELYGALGLYRGLAAKLGANWAKLYATDQGGSFLANRGRLQIDGHVTVDGGLLSAQEPFEVTGGTTVRRERRATSVAVPPLGWLRGW